MYSYDSPNPNESSIFSERPAVYATFGERFGAILIDWIILWVGSWPIEHFIIDHFWGNMVFGAVVGWLYEAIQFSGPNQATIGKRALGIKVTDTKGRRISFAQATGRHFSTYISAAILLVGYFMVLWDKNKQALHDKIADTLVVKQAPIVIP